MKLYKRVLSAVLAFAMVFSLFASVPLLASADESSYIYVDNINGLSTNTGETPDKAVDSLLTAYKIACAKEDGIASNPEATATFVLMNNASVVAGNFNIPKTGEATYTHVGTVTFTDNDGTTDYNAGIVNGDGSARYFQLGGPTVFDSLTLDVSNGNIYFYVGENFVMNDTVTTLGTDINTLAICGGWCRVTTSDTINMVINGGTVSYVSPHTYAASHGASTGDSNITIGGQAHVRNAVAGTVASKNSPPTNGTVTVTVNTGAVVDNYYAGGLKNGIVTASNLVLAGGTVSNMVRSENVTTANLTLTGYTGKYAMPAGSWNTVTFTGNSLVTMTEALAPDTNLVVDSGSVVNLAQDDSHTYTGEGIVYTSANASQSVVYVDADNGLDTNDGSAADKAVKTLKQAYALLCTKENGISKNAFASGTIVLMNDAQISTNFNLGTKPNKAEYTYVGELTITDNDGTTDYNAAIDVNSTDTPGNGRYVQIGGGPTVLDSLTLKASGGSMFLYVGDDFIMNSNVTTQRTGNWKIIVSGGFCRTNIADTVNITINGGTVDYVTPSTIATHGQANGDTNITIGGSAYILNVLTGGMLYTTAAGAADKNSAHGNVTVTVSSGAVVENYYAGSIYGSDGTVASSTLVLARGTVYNIKQSANSGLANITLDGYTGDYTLPQGSWNTLKVTGSSNVTMKDKLDSVTDLVVDANSIITLIINDDHSYTGEGTVNKSFCDHNWVQTSTVTGTCEKRGEIHYQCESTCGETKIEYTNFGEHTFTNGVCSACGGKDNVVFVADGGTGSGATASNPTGSLEDAYKLLVNNSAVDTDADASGVIVITGRLTIGGNFNTDMALTHKGTITYTSVDGDVDYRETNGAVLVFYNTSEAQSIQLGGPTVMENLTIDRVNSGAKDVNIYSASTLLVRESVETLNTNYSGSYVKPLEGLTEEQISSIMLSAHRGYQPMGPENSIASFQAAAELGFDYIETDVYMTADNQLVCIHDATIDRTFNGSGTVIEMTLAELQNYRMDVVKSAYGCPPISSFTDEELTIPTFQQYLQICKDGGAKAFLELKDYREGVTQAIIDMALQYLPAEDIVISTSSLEELQKAYDYAHNTLKVDLFYHLIWGVQTDSGYNNSIIELAKMTKVDSDENCAGIAFNVTGLTDEANYNKAKTWIEKANAAGLQTCLRGADDMMEVRLMFELGIDYYPTNITSPEMLVALKKPMGGWTYTEASGGKINVFGGNLVSETTGNISIKLDGGQFELVAPANAAQATTGSYSVTAGGSAYVNELVSGELAEAAAGNRDSSNVTVTGEAVVNTLYAAGDTAHTKEVTVNILGGKLLNIQERRSGTTGTAGSLTVKLGDPDLTPETMYVTNALVLTGSKELVVSGEGYLSSAYDWDGWNVTLEAGSNVTATGFWRAENLTVNAGGTLKLNSKFVENLPAFTGSGEVTLSDLGNRDYAGIADGTTGDVYWSFSPATGILTVYGEGDMGNYAPADVRPWNGYLNSIACIVADEGVTSLGRYAFYNCKNLYTLTLASSVETIGGYCFYGCAAIEQLVLPEGLRILAGRAFSYAYGLKTLYLPSTLEYVDMYAFWQNGKMDIQDVYYNGTAADRENIVFSHQGNATDNVLQAEWHYTEDTPISDIFADVKSDAWYADELKQLLDGDFLENITNSFGVNEDATYAQVLDLLYVRAGTPATYENALAWAQINGILPENCRPSKALTLNGLADILYRAALYNGNTITLGDANGSKTAQLVWLESLGVAADLYAANIALAPDSVLTRAEAAAVAAVFLNQDVATANRNDRIFAEVKAVVEAGGDGKLHILALDLTNQLNGDGKSGDSTLIVFPNGETMLIDAFVPAGAETLIQELTAAGITSLDYMVLSHPHNDHIGGMSAIAAWLAGNGGTIGRYYSSFAYKYAEDPEIALIEQLSTMGTELHTDVRAGDVITVGDVTINIYGPSQDYMEEMGYSNGSYSTETSNNIGMLMKFVYGDASYLTAGDLYISAERHYLEILTNGELDADVMKLDHHGGYTSNCFEWLDAVSPLICLAPTNCQGDSSQREYAASLGAQWYAAGYDGVVLVTMDKDKNISVTSQLDSTLREVYDGKTIQAACVHDLDTVTHHAVADAACTVDGNSEYWSCSCGKYFSDAECTAEIAKDSWVIKAGHSMKHHEAKAPTAAEDGNIEYYTCVVCGRLFDAQSGGKELSQEDVKIPALLPEPETSEPETTEPETSEPESSPDTGDGAALTAMAAVMLLAVAGFVTTAGSKKKFF